MIQPPSCVTATPDTISVAARYRNSRVHPLATAWLPEGLCRRGLDGGRTIVRAIYEQPIRRIEVRSALRRACCGLKYTAKSVRPRRYETATLTSDTVTVSLRPVSVRSLTAPFRVRRECSLAVKLIRLEILAPHRRCFFRHAGSPVYAIRLNTPVCRRGQSGACHCGVRERSSANFRIAGHRTTIRR